VADTGRSVLFHQCYKKRGHGPNGIYCRQHAKLAEQLGFSLAPDDEPKGTKANGAEGKVI